MTGAGKRLFSDAFKILTPELHKVGDKLHDATKRAKDGQGISAYPWISDSRSQGLAME